MSDTQPADTTRTPPAEPVKAAVDPADYTAWKSQRSAELTEQTAPASEPEAKPSEAPPGPTEAVVEPEATSAEDPESPEQDLEQDKEQPKAKAKPHKRPIQERFDELTRQRYEAEARAKVLEERLAKLEAKPAEEQPKAEVKAEAAAAGFSKTPSDFDSYEEWVEAYTGWKVDQALTARDTAQREAQETARREAANREVFDRWLKTLDAAKAAHQDFDEIVEATTMKEPHFRALQQVLAETDSGGEVLYRIVSDPALIEQVHAQTTLTGLTRLVGRVEASIAKEPEKPVPPTTKSASKAPAPVKPVTGGSAGAIPSVYDEKTAADYTAWRRTRRAELARRAQ
jgi:hypothetical protein